MTLGQFHPRRVGTFLAVAAAAVATALIAPAGAAGNPGVSPGDPAYNYSAGPFTNINVGGLAIGSCEVPEGCHEQPIDVKVPKSYYERLRDQGRVGAVEISLTWVNNENDFDLGLIDADGNVMATSGFGNSDFEKIVYTELPSGTYTIQSVVFRSVNTSIDVRVRLVELDPDATSVVEGTGGLSFSNGAPATFERSSGEPFITVDPSNGDLYADMPLGAGTNSQFWKSTDGGETWLPLGQVRPNQNPLPANAAGGGDSQTSVGSDGRVCISELNTLVSLGIACSSNGGETFGPASQVADPTTPLVDRQWQAATGNGEQFISAQFGILTVAQSQPGVRLYGDDGTGVFTKKADIDTGRAMKSYTLVADPSEDATLVQAYLRSNQSAGSKQDAPHQLMIWRSTDGGQTINRYVVANLPTTPGNNFASVATDTEGNVYVAWTEQGTWDVFYSMVSKQTLDATPDGGNLPWTKPVRVNANGDSATSIQPTIKVGDPGRVFIGFYGSRAIGNPDNLGLGTGEWNAFMSVSTNGDCQLDGGCGSRDRPSFRQAQINEHTVQFGGICLGGTGCGGDPYYGDRSMLEFLWIAFDPDTGAARVIYTDSSQASQNTVVTVARQTGGPSAYAGKPDVQDTSYVDSHISDDGNDAGFPTFAPIPKQAAPGADITRVELSLPGGDGKTLRVKIDLAEPNGLNAAARAGLGKQVFVGARFATRDDVFWVGWIHDLLEGGHAAAGHLDCVIVCGYATDPEIDVTSDGPDDDGTITLDVPVADLKTTLLRPAEVENPPTVRAFRPYETPLWAVTGYSFAATTSVDDVAVTKNPLDVTRAFTFSPEAQRDVSPPRPPDDDDRDNRGPLATTGLPIGVTIAGLSLLTLAVVLRRRAILRQR